jgi:hypothetical protein
MRKITVFLMFVVLLVSAPAFSGPEKTKKVIPLGKYDFYHYFTYDELTSYLQDMHKANLKWAGMFGCLSSTIPKQENLQKSLAFS